MNPFIPVSQHELSPYVHAAPAWLLPSRALHGGSQAKQTSQSSRRAKKAPARFG